VNPFYGADTNYGRLVPFSDYLKAYPYHDCEDRA
jgi:hypothetical protein